MLTLAFDLPDGQFLGYHDDDWYAIVSTSGAPYDGEQGRLTTGKIVSCTIGPHHTSYRLATALVDHSVPPKPPGTTVRDLRGGNGCMQPLLERLRDDRVGRTDARNRRGRNDGLASSSACPHGPPPEEAHPYPSTTGSHRAAQLAESSSGTRELRPPTHAPPLFPPPPLPNYGLALAEHTHSQPSTAPVVEHTHSPPSPRGTATVVASPTSPDSMADGTPGGGTQPPRTGMQPRRSGSSQTEVPSPTSPVDDDHLVAPSSWWDGRRWCRGMGSQ
jgi:hypothetical protein